MAMGIESFFVRNLFILHCLWKSEESEDCDSKLHSQDDVPSIARETSAAPAATFKRSNRKLNHHSAVANCVASSAPELPRRSTNSAKRPRLWLNELERNRSFRNRQVAGSIPALGSKSFCYLCVGSLILVAQWDAGRSPLPARKVPCPDSDSSCRIRLSRSQRGRLLLSETLHRQSRRPCSCLYPSSRRARSVCPEALCR
jgi:hypothetical protein